MKLLKTIIIQLAKLHLHGITMFLTELFFNTYNVTVTDANGCSNTDAVDVTVNPLPAIDAGSDQFNPTSTDVVSGHGIELDGINDYVSTGFDCDVGVVPATTWEAWIYPTLQKIQIATSNGIGFGWDRFLAIRNGQYYMGYGCNGWVAGTVDYNQWQHVAIVYNELSNEMKFYKNGVENVFSIPSNCSHTSNVTFTIGSSTQNGPTQFFAGKVDEVRLWEIVRTGSEIAANKDIVINPQTSGLSLYYRFEEGSGNSSDNLAGNNNNATLNNGINWITSNNGSSGTSSNTYSWDNNVTDGVSFSPTSTTTYTVTGTDSNGWLMIK